MLAETYARAVTGAGSTGGQELQSGTRHARPRKGFPVSVPARIQPDPKLVHQILKSDLSLEMALEVIGGAIEERGAPLVNHPGVRLPPCDDDLLTVL